jgi:pimeloyl-ACP methyl ester carboxylesterase
VHCAYPTAGPTAGPYPVVVVGHGLSLPAAQYYGYVKRLASFGYVALTVDFPSSPFSVDNPKEAKDLLAGLDWAKNKALIKADASNAGMTGHSLGGKVSLLAATMDPRVKASIVLDPVDGGGPTGCNAPTCVSVAPLMTGLHIPTGFLGETTDGAGGFMPCAPAASNFTTFYAKTNSPSLEVTVAGADHMSFLDDVSTCGFTCSFCNPATAPNAQVNGMARAYVVAFYERHLRGNAAYDTYLTGAEAQMRYVSTNQATITSK